MSAWPPAERPSAEAVQRRREILDARHRGDLDAVVSALGDPDDRVRASAVVLADDAGVLDDEALAVVAADESTRVRRAAATVAATASPLPACLVALLGDDDASVVEVACWAVGEHGDEGSTLLEPLITIAGSHHDPLCREAAVAALGAIGHPDGLAAILTATTDRATVRRRAVLALAPFDGPEVDAALERAMNDRDWQVRQAAEDLIG